MQGAESEKRLDLPPDEKLAKQAQREMLFYHETLREGDLSPVQKKLVGSLLRSAQAELSLRRKMNPQQAEQNPSAKAQQDSSMQTDGQSSTASNPLMTLIQQFVSQLKEVATGAKPPLDNSST